MSGAARVAWQVGNRPVVLDVEPASLLPVAKAFFPEDRVPPPDRRADVSLDARDLGRCRLRLPTGTWEVEGLGDLWVHVEMALAELLLRSVERVHILHGGALNREAGAVVFSGYGGAGKSTLTAAAAAAGHPVYGDDVVLLEWDTGVLRPFRRLLKVPDDSRRLLGLPRPGGPLDELWPDATLYRPEDLGSTWADPAPVQAVLFPLRGGAEDGTAPHLRELKGGDAAHRLILQLLLVDRTDARAFEDVAAVLAAGRIAELRYADARTAVAALDQLLASPSTSSPFM